MDSDIAEHARLCAKSALGNLPRRWVHVQGVARAAGRTTALVEVEHALTIVAAAWLHDVGYAESIRTTGFHPLDGAKYAKERGFPDIIVSLVAYHTGAMVEATERRLSLQLSEFAEPPARLLDVLTFADLTTSPAGEPIGAQDRVQEILSRYEKDDPVHRAVTKSAPGLLAAVDRVERRIDQATTSN